MTTFKQTLSYFVLALCLATIVPQTSFADWTAAGSTATIDEVDTAQFAKSGDRLYVKISAGTVTGRYAVNPNDLGSYMQRYFLTARFHDRGSKDRVYLKLLRTRVSNPGGLQTVATLDSNSFSAVGWQTRSVSFNHAFEPGWAYYVEAVVTKGSGGNPILVAVEIADVVS
jgi:hypothetical protein